MILPRSAITALAMFAAAIAGCRCPSCRCVPATPHAPCCLNSGAGEELPPDLMNVVPDCEAEQCGLTPLPSPEEIYTLLTPEEAQCRAATNANVANMIVLEEHWASVIIECDSRYVGRNVCLQKDLLELHAADVRNRAAATALEAFYRLAALEARRHYLDLAIDEVARSRERVRNLEQVGTTERMDAEEFAIQLAQLNDERLQLQYFRIQLNGQLQKLIGCPVSERTFFWPVVDWTPDMTPLDPDAEVARSINGRFDIRGLSLMLCKLEKSTLRVARGVLQVADPTVGSVEPTPGWIHRLRCILCGDHEVDVRCRQLSMLYADTEQLATAEIKGAVFEVAMQQHRVAGAREAVAGRRAGLHELTAKRDIDDVPVFEISRARTRLYTAESDLIVQVSQLKIAQVHVSKAEARLAAQCGFEPRLCCEGDCTGACTRCQARTCGPCELPENCDKCRRAFK